LKAGQEVKLQEYLGGSGTYTLDSSFFHTLPAVATGTSLNDHPLIRISAGRVMIGHTDKISLQRTLHPKLSLWGTTYARGSGIRYDGYVNSEDGLSFSRYNYGVGLILSIPLLRFTNVRHQLNAQESLIKADEGAIESHQASAGKTK
jgi:hypothetical protein